MMAASRLQIRTIPFHFTGCDFLWNPQQPAFSILMNQISFLAIGLEKYFCLAIRDAEPLIRDDRVREEARLFRAQESIHSRAHRNHVNALIARYPGLKETLRDATAHYDALYAREDLQYHLAYAGALESIFTPTFRMILDNRKALFADGDASVASLFIWHFCEEMEHRSSALMIYDHVYGSYMYRTRRLRSFLTHASECRAIVTEGCKKHIPDIPEDYYTMNPFAAVPTTDMLRFKLGVLASQTPWHNPDNAKLPAYFADWNAGYDRGDDMSQVYGRIARTPPAHA